MEFTICWHRQSWINQFTLIIYAIVTILISSQHQCLAQQQKFRVTPHDLQVLEGSEALMRCEVANLAGAVQWTKDGFALGFSAVIPGFPRYSVLGDRKQGVYNLRISNASIDDDAEYQCQVGPARLNSAIRANAKLTVISPPASIEIEGYASAARVEVRENQDLTLKCIVANAKPAAQIVWQRAGKEYKPESREDKVMESKAKRFTTTSRLELKPSSEDDYKNYTCQARHKALPPDMPMREHVQLSVLYPPGPPYIEGLTKEETLRRGQIVNLTCHSRGGNPPAQLIWYKNGAQVRMAYRTHGRISENTYTFTAESSDNKAKLRCEASNVMSPMALKTEMDLTVLFAPTHVTITAPNEARVGEVVPLTCTTAPSNPPAEIKWLIGNRSVHNATSRTVFSSEGGWSTSSNATTVIEPNKQSLIVICQSFNMQLTENVMSTHTINILHPPSPPVISGYVEGQIIPAGSVQKLACVSSGGNPLATLTWSKNDKRINSIVQTQTDSVSAEITILANVTDNQARYRCEAHNSATEIPLFESKVLSVHFAPETVKIHIKPEQLKPNTEATLICDSSSSNPPAKVSWWNQGILIQGVNSSSKQGLWGGTVSTLELKVNLTQEMNGVVYTCQSTNEALQRSVHEAITLDILYPPKFVPPPLSTVVGIEGESLQVALKANANPMSITYSWTKDGLPIKSNNGKALQRITSNNSVLNITKLHRNDAGLYKCEATNSQGTASIIITIAVQYGTVITSISENVVVNPGEDAMLSCTVDGSPLTEEHIKWERLVYDMTVKTSTSFANGTSFLHIKNAQRDDVGNFRCIADNRVGNPTNRDVLLIVKFAPEIDKSPTLLRAASGTGERGRIPCRAKAAPKPSFTWKMGGKDLPTGRTYKYEVEEKIIDSLTYESILIVDKVAPADYGAYECVAQNEIGVVEETVRLDITSPPDAPISLNILNVTHDSVILAWTPGFDGGLKATYRVRYREATKDQYRYIDALPNSHKLKIAGLRMNTLYLFSVMAQNDLGASKFLPDLTRAQTKEAPPPSAPASSLGGPPTTSSTPLGGTSGLLLLIGVIAGIVVVLLNIFIIGCCLHKRNQKRMKRGKILDGSDQAPAEIDEKSEIPKLVIIGIALAAFGLLLVNAALVAWFIIKKRKKEASNQNSKSATIEMYAPSSYNDTMTGETLSSVSEKSDSYSNEGSQPDYIDETRKKAASTYLVENPDMPPPRYQKDGTLPSLMYPNHSVNSRTLPHPRHNNQQTTNNDLRARDDQMLVTKGVYMPSPSPAPPMDGSYYNMNSDRYLSYPPLDYPTMEFTTPPLPMAHLQPNQTTVITSGGTLRRGIMRGVIGVPPPDVTHHTNNIPQASMLHDLHSNNLTTSSTQSNGSTQMTNLSGLSSHQTSTPKQPPQGILKDPKRNQMQLQQQQQQQLQQQQIPPQQQLITGIPVVGSANMQILNVTSAPGIGNSLLIGTYDPNAHNNLSTFNTSMGYTDADGHLV